METGLKIIIGAEDQATPVFVKTTAGAKQTAEAFAKIPPEAKKAEGATNSLVQSITRVPPVAQKTTQAVAQVGQSLNTYSRGSNSAMQATINLSRVVQDAPYGFLGIANNLNPLLESFQRLRAETGSVKGAIGALGSSLTGAGGIGLALGIVSSLLVVFGDKLFGSKKKTEEQDEALKNLNRTLEDSKREFDNFLSSIEALDRIGTINIKIAGLPDVLDLQAQKIGRDEALFAAEEREKELLNIYSKSLTESQEVQDAAFKALRDHQAKLTDLRSERTLAERQIALQRKKDADEALDKQKEINDKEAKQAKEQADRLKKIYEQRQLEIKQFLATPALPNEEVRKFVQRETIDVKPSDKLTELKVPVAFDFDFSNLPQNLLDAIKKAELKERINEAFAEGMRNLQVEAFAGIGDAIAEGLAGGNIGDALKGMFSTLGSVIQQLGAQIIALSPIIKAVKTAIESFSPVGILAAGIGLVALGGVIKKATTAKFAEGGVVFGPTLGLMGEYAGASSNPEVIAPLNKLKDLLGDRGSSNVNLNGEFRINGYDLALLLSRVNQRQGRSF